MPASNTPFGILEQVMSQFLLTFTLLQIRGYIGLPVLGRSQIWQRFAFFRDRMFAMLNLTNTGE